MQTNELPNLFEEQEGLRIAVELPLPEFGPQMPTQSGGRDFKSNLINAQPGFEPT